MGVSDAYKKAATKPRIKYSPEQLELLEGAFRSSQYPDTETLDDLADKLDISTDKVSVWFQNRRSKFKRQSKDSHVAWMRKQFYNSDMRSSCQVISGDGKQHVLSPPNQVQEVPENPICRPISNLHYMPYIHQDSNPSFDHQKASFPPRACQFPFPVSYGPIPSTNSFWDQMDVQQRNRILSHLMSEQAEQHQTISRPSCQYTTNVPQFPPSYNVPSLTVPSGLGF
ncbi:retinal homeobox protein Rx1-like [Saccostrea echinata]|uniref:retinal homeobox protein Rx1-like n=1 Tax=Saccostrea echinata TaxID=191078 RepID=UPI002A809232|nr:retinal homeobox protein Rx1-like [Saccostrea echinata]